MLKLLSLLLLLSGCFATPYESSIAYLNAYRSQFSAPPLVYSEQVTQVAQAWADYLADSDQFKHSTNNMYGENIAMGYASSQAEFDRNGLDYYVKDALDRFNNEEKLYDWDKPGYSDKTGHFTQNVWVASRSIGIGVAYNPISNRVIVVNNFDPAGNSGGAENFRRNVLPKKSVLASPSPPPPPKTLAKPPPRSLSPPPPPKTLSKPPLPSPPSNVSPPPSPYYKRPIYIFIRKSMPRQR